MKRYYVFLFLLGLLSSCEQTIKSSEFTPEDSLDTDIQIERYRRPLSHSDSVTLRQLKIVREPLLAKKGLLNDDGALPMRINEEPVDANLNGAPLLYETNIPSTVFRQHPDTINTLLAAQYLTFKYLFNKAKSDENSNETFREVISYPKLHFYVKIYESEASIKPYLTNNYTVFKVPNGGIVVQH